MASDFMKALDQLAGVAGSEIEKSRQFRINMIQQAQTLDRQAEQFDREMRTKEARNRIAENELKLAQMELEHKTSSDLTSRDAEIASLEKSLETQKQIAAITKAQNDLGKAKIGAVMDGMQQIVEGFEAGAPAEFLEQGLEIVDRIARQNLGIGFDDPVDFSQPQAGFSADSPPPIEPGKNFDATLKLRKQFNDETKTFQEVQRQVGNIEVAADRLLNMSEEEFNRIGIDQAVITSFNKILDPESVVRESEYERTPANESIVRRAKGFIEQLKGGGSGITQTSILELRDTARAMAKIRREIANKKGSAVRQIGAKRGLNPDEIGTPFAPFKFETQGQQQLNNQTFQTVFSGRSGTNVPANQNQTFDINSHRQKFGL